MTLRLTPVRVRAAGYQVLVQQADGSLLPFQAAASHAYLGTVDGDSAASAAGIVNSDGDFVGQVDFDRGGTIYVTNGTVTGSRSLTQPTTYKWPSAGDSSLNATTTRGQAGRNSYEWDLGYDLDNGYFNAAPIGGSLAKAVEQVDLDAVSLLGVYETDLLVHPEVRRVVIRAAAAKDPYAGETQGQRLGTVSSQWATIGQADLDDVAVLTDRDAGSGVAYLSTAGNPGHADAGGTGSLNIVVQRHEFGHTWSALDNHTNGPEGATINSGNGYDRWDGTELRSMLNYRNAHLASFTSLGTFRTPLPPYASLDLVDHMMSRVAFRLDPTVNDHDTNGHTLALRSVSSRSHLGGRLTRSGNTVTYTPPAVTTAQTVDWARYVVKDATTGMSATGVMLFRVDPYVAPPASSTWPVHAPHAASAYQLVNRQSGLVAAIKRGAARGSTLIQRRGADAAAQWAIRPSGSGERLRNRATGLCATVRGNVRSSGADVIQDRCDGHTDQQWRIVDHPAGGRALISVRSGLCLAVRGSSISSGATLMQTRCGLSTAGIWAVRLTSMSTWPVASPPTTGNQELVNAGTGLHVGTAAGASWSANFVQQAPSAQTALTFLPNADGSWRVRQTASGLCFNDAAAQHADIVLWNCNETTTGGAFRILRHPEGGVSIVGVLAKTCVGVDGASSTAGAKIEFEPCNSADETQRWRIRATP